MPRRKKNIDPQLVCVKGSHIYLSPIVAKTIGLIDGNGKVGITFDRKFKRVYIDGRGEVEVRNHTIKNAELAKKVFELVGRYPMVYTRWDRVVTMERRKEDE